MSKENELKRSDDKFMRYMVGGLLSSLVLIGITTMAGFIYSQGKLEQRLTTLEQNVNNNSERLESLGEIKPLIQTLNDNVTKLGNAVHEVNTTLNKVALEQSRRTEIVKNANKHINDPKLHNFK